MSDQTRVIPPSGDGAVPEPTWARLLPGDRLPFLRQQCSGRPSFAFDTMAGRYALFCFFLSAEDEAGRRALDAVGRRRDLFNDLHCSFIGVSFAPADRTERGLRDALPGIRYAWDFDFTMSRACGAVPQQTGPDASVTGRRFWLLVDPSLHVLQIFPFSTDPQVVIETIANLPPPDDFGGVHRPAPILLLPNIFEPEFCRELIADYEAGEPEESGVLRAGKNVLDAGFKRRRDHTLTNAQLIRAANARIWRRVRPEIERLFFMKANYIERHIVGCYAAEDGGHFSPHTDNGPGLSAHRRFAVSINLNGGFEGGAVAFPEYSTKGYKAPPGWAIVFPCAALHQVQRVTAGVRYAFLPFVHDDVGEAMRVATLAKAD